MATAKKADNGGGVALPVVYAGNDEIQLAVNGLTEAQVLLLASRTPQAYIQKKKGRGGQFFDYVEINYVIAMLNAIFGFDWSVEVIDRIIHEASDSIVVQIRLSARFKDGREVHKDAYGGSDIKRKKDSSRSIIDLADDLKAAESDGIKKAASMLGIAWDVYSGVTKSTGAHSNGKSAGLDEFDAPSKSKKGDGYPEFEKRDGYQKISLSLADGSTATVTRFEAFKHFDPPKESLGDARYYEILGSFGYSSRAEIPDKNIPKIYSTLIQAIADGDDFQAEAHETAGQGELDV